MEFVMASLAGAAAVCSSAVLAALLSLVRNSRNARLASLLSGVRSSLYLFPSSADAALFKTPLVTDQSPNMSAKLLDF